MNHRTGIVTAAILGICAVGLGAFGAHGLKPHLTPEQLAMWEKGVQYQFYHLPGIILAALLQKDNEHRRLSLAGWLFLIGIVCFSGSLYLLSCRTLLGIESWRWLGPVTPLGGLSFMTGWVLLAWHQVKNR